LTKNIFEMTQGQSIFGTFLSCEGTLQVGFQADARKNQRISLMNHPKFIHSQFKMELLLNWA